MMINIVSQTINTLAKIEHRIFQNESLLETIENMAEPIKQTPATIHKMYRTVSKEGFSCMKLPTNIKTGQVSNSAISQPFVVNVMFPFLDFTNAII